MALAERKEVKDYVSVYDAVYWKLIHVSRGAAREGRRATSVNKAIAQTFPVDTLELEGLQWSPDGNHLVVWDTLLEVITTRSSHSTVPFLLLIIDGRSSGLVQGACLHGRRRIAKVVRSRQVGIGRTLGGLVAFLAVPGHRQL